jgi:hypothetical protein
LSVPYIQFARASWSGLVRRDDKQSPEEEEHAMRTPRFAGLGLGAAVIGILAVPAAAEVVVFDNSTGPFLWEPAGLESEGNRLDITQPPTQTGVAGNNGFGKYIGSSATSCSLEMASSNFFAEDGARIAISNAPIRFTYTGCGAPTGVTVYKTPSVPYAPTQPIDADALWAGGAVFVVNFAGMIILTPLTLGASITLPDGVHYGWIRIGTVVIDGGNNPLQPVAWAYETEPGVAIPAWGVPDADGVLHVPLEYPNIRGALNDALPGQTVLVADGVYAGLGNRLLDFHGKSLTLRSENGPANCIIDGENLNRGIHFHSGEGPDAVVDGFTIMNCVAHGLDSEVYGTVGGGAGICCELGSSPTIRNCIVRNNTCEYKGFKPDFTDSAGIKLKDSSAALANCLIHGNFCGSTPAISASGGAPTLVNCTMAFNQATLSEFSMGEGAVGSDSIVMTNCIVAWNGPASFADGSTATVTYSCIEGGWPGMGNINSDPQFVDTFFGDYHLAAGSPCIDAASNPAVPRDVTEDLDGNPRFQDDPATIDTGLGRAPIVDMGAFEFQSPLDPADLDEDGDVDGFDLALLLGQWGRCTAKDECAADLDGNGIVNGFDLAILLAAWG